MSTVVIATPVQVLRTTVSFWKLGMCNEIARKLVECSSIYKTGNVSLTRSCNHCWLGIQDAMRMRHIVNIFPRYLINNTILKNTLLNIKCVFHVSLQLLSEKGFYFNNN
jgi:hypothetical protein